MATTKDLTDFVRAALQAGHGRAEIDTALSDAGWSSSDIAEALAAFADGPFLPPVPRPRRYLASRDAFVYALMFLTLGLTAGFLISLIFAIIDLWVPDLGATTYRVMAAEGQIRWAFAVLVLAMPLYLWLMYLTESRIEADAGGGRSVLRKWLTYLALLASAMALLGDAINVIYRLLAGDATLEFLLKSITVGVVTAAIFGFYLRDVEWRQGRGPNRWFGVGVAAVVVAALVAGFWSIGGPGQARRDRADALRMEDFAQIARILECSRNNGQATGPLPDVLTRDSLTEYCPGQAILTAETLLDPVSRAPYTYHRVGDHGFRICTTFYDAARAAERRPAFYPFDPDTGCISGQAD